jgi:hypothetical protein
VDQQVIPGEQIKQIFFIIKIIHMHFFQGNNLIKSNQAAAVCLRRLARDAKASPF